MMKEEITFTLRGDASISDREDMSVDFDWNSFSADDHAMWTRLFNRQMPVLKGRACNEYLDGIKKLGLTAEGGIPKYDEVSAKLMALTGWKLVTVAGYLPIDVFWGHLAKRQFPVTTFIRTPDEIDYLQEPDIFHDLFGHVPMLTHPEFAEYFHAFGEGGLRAIEHGYSPLLETLYWFTVEFGLINTDEGMRIYGAGIVSSKGESEFCLSEKATQVAYDMQRVMATKFRIDTFQNLYFVIDSFKQLMDSTAVDFLPVYEAVEKMEPIGVAQTASGDKILQQGKKAAA
jgi:phenylalanine-4-hydroxylase